MGTVLHPFRRALSLCALLAGFVAAAGRAAAEEAIVLDNGAILRGSPLREDSVAVEFRLSGVGTDSRVTIRKDRITQRIVTVDPRRPLDKGFTPSAPASEPESAPMQPEPEPVAAPKPPPIPAEEPSAAEEGFFHRTARLAVLAFPEDPAARALLAALGMVVLLCLVGLGARMADVQGVTLGNGTILAGLLGAFVTLDAMMPEVFLRADTAPWLLPTQLAAWVIATSGIVRCGLGRALTLLAFVLFSGALVTFASGAVLVTV